MILSVALMLGTYYLCSFIDISFMGLLLKALICLIVPNLIFIICFGRTKSFKELMKILMSILPKKRKVKNESSNGV